MDTFAREWSRGHSLTFPEATGMHCARLCVLKLNAGAHPIGQIPLPAGTSLSCWVIRALSAYARQWHRLSCVNAAALPRRSDSTKPQRSSSLADFSPQGATSDAGLPLEPHRRAGVTGAVRPGPGPRACDSTVRDWPLHRRPRRTAVSALYMCRALQRAWLLSDSG
jgi:hypothetical protein